MSGFPPISLILFVPLIGALVVAGLHREQHHLIRWTAFVFSLLSLLLTFGLWFGFDSTSALMQFEEQHAWIPSLNVQYHVGVDGLGLVMMLLTGVVMPFAIIASRGIQTRIRAYFGLMLMLQAGLYGTFSALNFVHWFIYWELSLVPAYFLVKLWGGPGCVRAANQFFLYTTAGSVTLLLAFQALYLATGTFDFVELAGLAKSGGLSIDIESRLAGKAFGLSTHAWSEIIFVGVLLGFAVKTPLMPFHTWLPSTYQEAPTPVTMVLTGLMSKMGLYGFLRILLPIFPEQIHEHGTTLLALAVATIVLSSAAALAQRDLKRMLAYSSINHLGICLLGVFAVAQVSGSEALWAVEQSAALNGILLQMVNHGISAAALFYFVGLIEERSAGLRGLDDFGGLRKPAPIFCGIMGIALFCSLGLPGLGGFVGEFLIFKGVFAITPWAASFAVIGLLLTAVFLLSILQRVFSGPLNPRWAGFADLTWKERGIVLPIIGLMFLLGVWPQLLIGVANKTLMAFSLR